MRKNLQAMYELKKNRYCNVHTLGQHIRNGNTRFVGDRQKRRVTSSFFECLDAHLRRDSCHRVDGRRIRSRHDVAAFQDGAYALVALPSNFWFGMMQKGQNCSVNHLCRGVSPTCKILNAENRSQAGQNLSKIIT